MSTRSGELRHWPRELAVGEEGSVRRSPHRRDVDGLSSEAGWSLHLDESSTVEEDPRGRPAECHRRCACCVEMQTMDEDDRPCCPTGWPDEPDEWREVVERLPVRRPPGVVTSTVTLPKTPLGARTVMRLVVSITGATVTPSKCTIAVARLRPVRVTTVVYVPRLGVIVERCGFGSDFAAGADLTFIPLGLIVNPPAAVSNATETATTESPVPTTMSRAIIGAMARCPSDTRRLHCANSGPLDTRPPLEQRRLPDLIPPPTFYANDRRVPIVKIVQSLKAIGWRLALVSAGLTYPVTGGPRVSCSSWRPSRAPASSWRCSCAARSAGCCRGRCARGNVRSYPLTRRDPPSPSTRSLRRPRPR